MSWLRMDDGFTSNAKIAQLTDRDFRIWFRLLCHCARSHDPSVDVAAMNEVAGLTRGAVARFAALGLLDQVGTGAEVHDWVNYQPKDGTSQERKERWRARQTVPEPSPGRSENRSESVPATVPEPFPRARARAGSRPVPSLETVEGKPSTALALVGSSTIGRGSQTLVGEFVDDARSRNVDVPRKVIGQVAANVKQLLDEGIEPVRVRAGLSRMLDRGKIIPSSLANFVMEAGLPTNGQRYGRGMTTAQILSETRGLA